MSQFKIRTDDEFVQVLRQLQQYAVTRRIMAREENPEKALHWGNVITLSTMMFRNAELHVDHDGIRQHQRGPVDLVGLNDAELKQQAWERAAAEAEEQRKLEEGRKALLRERSGLQASINKFDVTDHYEGGLMNELLNNIVHSIPKYILVEQFGPRINKALKRLTEVGAIVQERGSNGKVWVSLAARQPEEVL